MKKIQKKARQDKGGKDSESDKEKPSVKEEEPSTLQTSPFGRLGASDMLLQVPTPRRSSTTAAATRRQRPATKTRSPTTSPPTFPASRRKSTLTGSTSRGTALFRYTHSLVRAQRPKPQLPHSRHAGLDLKSRREDYLGLPFPNSIDSSGASIFVQPPAAHQSHPHTLPGLNPIDRLYSMQNSYFCEEEAVEP